jgi:hypothetical protein
VVETIGLLEVEVVLIMVEVELDQNQHLLLVLVLVDFMVVPQMAGELLQVRVVEVVEEHMVLEILLPKVDLAVPVLSLSLILHKYSKTTIRWLFVRSIIHKQDF